MRYDQIKRFSRKIETIIANRKPEAIVSEESASVLVVDEELPSIDSCEKRSQRPLNIEDDEKRRSTRNVPCKDRCHSESRLSSRSLGQSHKTKM